MRQMRESSSQWRTTVWAVVIIGLTGVAYADTAEPGWYDPVSGDPICEVSVLPGVPFDVNVGVLLTDTVDGLTLGGYEMDIVDDSASFGSTATPGVTLTVTGRTILPTGWMDISLTPPPIDLWVTALDAAAVSLQAGTDLLPGPDPHMLETLTLQVPGSVALEDIDYYLVILPESLFAASGGGAFDVELGCPLHIVPEPASLACFSVLFGASLLRRRWQ